MSTDALGQEPKLFVLDTNVLMHDPSCLRRFKDNDLFIPMITLEELDNNKKGHTEVARNARMSARMLDELTSGAHPLGEGIPLGAYTQQEATGRLFIQTVPVEPKEEGVLIPNGKADNQIIAVVVHLSKAYPNRRVILVTKDINMRIKARALGIAVEDYLNDQVIEDANLLPTGVHILPANFWELCENVNSWKENTRTRYTVESALCKEWCVNDFLWLEEDDRPFNVVVEKCTARSALLVEVRDYRHANHNVWGITARNREQEYALNLLMNPDIDLVMLLGQAGTGKTLLTLAAGLQLTIGEHPRYMEVLFTRVTIPVGEDIGFLPGDEEEKMMPWMGALDDNLDVLVGNTDTQHKDNNHQSAEWGRAATKELIRSRVKVKSLNFMRGRTFLKKFVVIDEAQNLTPKQMKTLITRAGPGTKMVVLGNLAQIDTPYLTEGSSGLSYLVERMKNWPHAGHVTLMRGERSRLADHAAEVL